MLTVALLPTAQVIIFGSLCNCAMCIACTYTGAIPITILPKLYSNLFMLHIPTPKTQYSYLQQRGIPTDRVYGLHLSILFHFIFMQSLLPMGPDALVMMRNERTSLLANMNYIIKKRRQIKVIKLRQLPCYNSNYFSRDRDSVLMPCSRHTALATRKLNDWLENK